MARYDTEHKAATRQRIVDSAGMLFKRSGLDGSGIAGLMTNAGLTNGAFYAHFDSKDDLIATVVGDQMNQQVETIRNLPADVSGLRNFIREYLSPEHRDNPSLGCPSAALLDEIARGSNETKQAYTEGARSIIDEIAARLSPGQPESARSRAIGLYTMMVGTLQLARSLADDSLSREVLASGVTNAEAFVD